MILGKKSFFSMKKEPGFFIFVDMLIALIISMMFLMMFFSGFEKVHSLKVDIEQLIIQRNLVTQILSSKEYFVLTNNLKEDRTYEILPGVFVDIYHIKFEEQVYKKFGLKKIEYGIIENRKGE